MFHHGVKFTLLPCHIEKNESKIALLKAVFGIARLGLQSFTCEHILRISLSGWLHPPLYSAGGGPFHCDLSEEPQEITSNCTHDPKPCKSCYLWLLFEDLPLCPSIWASVTALVPNVVWIYVFYLPKYPFQVKIDYSQPLL